MPVTVISELERKGSDKSIEASIRLHGGRDLLVEGISSVPRGSILPAAHRLVQAVKSREQKNEGPGVYVSSVSEANGAVFGKPIAVLTKSGNVFLGINNGSTSLALQGQEVEMAVEISPDSIARFLSSPRASQENVFGALSARIANGVNISHLGSEIHETAIARIRADPGEKDGWKFGYVVDLGSNGDVITNLPNSFAPTNAAVSVRISVNRAGESTDIFARRIVVRGVALASQNGPVLFCLKTPAGCLSIANKGHAAREIGLDIDKLVLDENLIPAIRISISPRGLF